MDKDGDKKGGDKKGGQSGAGLGGAAGGPDPASLLDAASLFAYWGRDPSAMAAAASNSALFGSQFGMPGGLGGLMPNAAAAAAAAAAATGASGSDRFQMGQHPNTMAVAASQAASLAGLHNSWWSMAQLAAQDYFARLQASGMAGQMPFPHGADLASAFPGGLGGLGAMGGAGAGGGAGSGGAGGAGGGGGGGSNGKGGGGGKGKKRDRSSNSNSSNASSTGGAGGGGAGGANSVGGYKNSSSPSVSQAAAAAAYKQSLYSQATLHKELMAITAAAAAAQQSPSGNSGGGGGGGGGGGSSKSKSSSGGSNRGSSGGSSNDILSMTRGSSASPSVNSSKSQGPSPSVTISASNMSGGNHLQGMGGGGRSGKDGKGGGQNMAADLGLSASMNALNTLSQFGNLDLSSPQNVTATMNALAASSAKAKDYMSSGILNDPSSLLGVRLPPDTEIIKYTSSIVGGGPKGSNNSNNSGNSGGGGSSRNRNKNKTAPIEESSLFAQLHGMSTAKRARMDPNDYSGGQGTTGTSGGTLTSGGGSGGNNDRIEVIKLPPTITSNGVYNSGKGKDSMADQINDWAGLNLSGKGSSAMANSLAAAAAAVAAEAQDDAPLNLSMKSSKSDSRASPAPSPAGSGSTPSANSLQSLSTITAALGGSGGNDTPRSQFKEGRPRNLGRGVSKPKKNTVASLLAQSRAVGSKPLTAQQLLTQEAEIEKLRQAMIEASQSMESTSNTNTDTESVAESGMSESEGEEQINVKELRVPLEKGWRRETVIRGLTKNGQIKGDVFYYPPQSLNKMKGMNQVQLYLDQFKPKDLTRDNFSFSAKAIVGTFLQPAPPPYATDGEYIKMTDVEVARRLEELKMFTRHTALGVEQRIEIAKQQQALRDAKKMAKDEISKNKEKARQAKEIERNERLEQQRKERELKNQQAMEAKRKREEELARQKAEEAARKQQELAKQKELMYAVEMERERRRQHMTLIKQLELRRKFEEKEKKKHQVILDKLIQREKKLTMRKRDTSILQELRKPQEDTEIGDQPVLPNLPRIPGLKLTGTGFADLLMVFEFLHNFGETLGFSESTDMEALPTLQSLHSALTCENAIEAEEELLSVMTHLLVCAIEDPGIPNPGRHTTLLGQTLRQADITHSNVSEILRIYLYAVAHGEVKQQSGISLERERERHHLPTEEDIKTASDKNRQFYELLSENLRYKLSELLKDKPFVALNPTTKVQILAMLCNDLLLNKAVCKQIEGSLETQAQLKKERYLLDNKIRKYKMLVARKQRLEQYEKAQAAALEKSLQMKAAEEAKRAEEAAAAAAAAEGIVIAPPTGEDNQAAQTQPQQTGEEKTEGGEGEVLDATAPPTTDSAPVPAEAEQNHKDETVLNPSQESLPPLNNGTITPMEDCPIKAPPMPHQLEESKSKELSFSEMGEHAPGGDVDHSFSKSMTMHHEHAPSERNDDDNSDLESEGTQLEEDEDAHLTAEEAQRKYDKILETSFQNKSQLEYALNQLRVKCFGQDRYWRRYWCLPKCGGVYVEAMESAQPDVCKYECALEEAHASQEAAKAEAAAAEEAAAAAAAEAVADAADEAEGIPRFIPTIADIVKRDRDKNKENKDANEFPSHHIGGLEERKRKRSGRSKKKHDFFNQECTNDSESQDVQDEDNSRTSFSNCEETRTDSQSEAEHAPAPVTPVAPPVIEEPPKPVIPPPVPMVQEPPVPPPIMLGAAKKKREDDHLMDIEDSIPTAILVQKGNNHDETKIVEVNNQIGGVNLNSSRGPQEDNDVQLVQEETPTITIPDDDTESGDQPLRETEQSAGLTTNGGGVGDAGSNCDIKPKLENGEIGADEEMELGEIKSEERIKKELNSDQPMDRWFSIVDKELPLASTECPLPSIKGTTPSSIARQVYTNITCREICQIQGNRWDIGNNIQFFSVPLEKMVEIHFKNESILSLSGLDEDEMADVIAKKIKLEPAAESDTKPTLIPKRESIDESQLDVKPDVKQEGEAEEYGTFSLPAYMTLTLSNLTAYVQCDQFQPLQMTPEEERQLEEVKARGTLAKPEVKHVPKDLRHGWWKINDIEELNELIKSLNPRGVRERSLRQSLLESLQESVNLSTPFPVAHPRAPITNWTESEAWNAWNPAIARRVEIALLDQIEAMEDKVASASMQMKGWQVPQRDGDSDNGIVEDVSIEMLRERIAGLESAIERRYLKPPLGINTTEAQMAVIAQQEAHHHATMNSSNCSNSSEDENIPKGLMSWRDAVERSVTTAQLSMALYVLESCVAWDKSIMKANCQFCQSGEQEDKLLLCDGCDRGYHTYCFKPRMDKIPDGDWYCFECKNKATGDRKCIVCGGLRPPPLGKMVYCELCPRAYHQDCYIPPMLKYPRGKWYCTNCIGKAPPKKKPQRKPKEKSSNHNTSLNQSSLSNQSANQSLNSSHEEIPQQTSATAPCPMTSPTSATTPCGGVAALQTTTGAAATPGTTPLSPAHSVASTTTTTTTHEEPLSTATTTTAATATNPADFSQMTTMPTPPAIAFPQYANLEGTPASSVLNSFQLPQPPSTATTFDAQQQHYQQYYQSQQQQQQYYPDYVPESQPPSSQSQPEAANTSMDNTASSLNASSLGSNDDSTADYQPQEQHGAAVPSTPTSGGYSPSGSTSYDEQHNFEKPPHHQESSSSEEQQPVPAPALTSSSSSSSHKKDKKDRDEAREQAKKEKKATKKLMKELAPCKAVLEEMEVNEDSWPFLLPVNTKQFPTYRKVIKNPMDLSTIKKRLQDMVYKSRDDFIGDVRQIFDNCEMFNEDDSPVGTAGHGMRKYFEQRWAELTEKHSGSS